MEFAISGGSAGAVFAAQEREEQGVRYIDIRMTLPEAAAREVQ